MWDVGINFDRFKGTNRDWNYQLLFLLRSWGKKLDKAKNYDWRFNFDFGFRCLSKGLGFLTLIEAKIRSLHIISKLASPFLKFQAKFHQIFLLHYPKVYKLKLTCTCLLGIFIFDLHVNSRVQSYKTTRCMGNW